MINTMRRLISLLLASVLVFGSLGTFPQQANAEEIHTGEISEGADNASQEQSQTPVSDEDADSPLQDANTLAQEELFTPTNSAQDLAVLSIITGDGYEFDTNTGKLSITSNAGTVNWTTDQLVDRQLVTSLYVSGTVASFPIGCFLGLNLTGIVDISTSKVSRISDRCFFGNNNMTGIILPANVQSIGEESFSQTGLTGNLDLSSYTSLTTIGSHAFSGTPSLTNLSLPNSLLTLGSGAFKTSGLMNATVNLSNCSSLTYIPSNCFNGTGLASIILPAGIQGLGSNAFSYTRLSGTLDLSSYSSLSSINDSCFAENRSITGIKLPSSLTTIGAHAFFDTSLNGVLDLSHCTSLTTIGESAFMGTWYLSGLVLPDSLSTLGVRAFTQSGLVDVTVDLSNTALTAIPNSCFSDTFIKNFVLPQNIQTLGDYAFANTRLNSLLDLSSYTNLTSIGEGCFSGCIGITRFKLPNSIQSLGKSCFVGTTLIYSSDTLDLSSLSNLKSIGESCFAGQTYIATLALPEGLQELDASCFERTGLVGSLQLPSTLTTLGQDAFSGTALTGLVFTGDTAPSMPNNIIHAGAASYFPVNSSGSYLAQAGLPKPAYAYDNNTDARIVSFTLWGEAGVVDEVNKRIFVCLPSHAKLTSLKPSISYFGASISPLPDIAQDFTNPINYTVTPVSGSAVTYTVHVLEGRAPTSQTISLGQAATFTVETSSDTSIQWQVNRGDGNGFVNILPSEGSGAQTATYTTPTVPIATEGFAMNGWCYRALLTVEGIPVEASTTTAALFVTKIKRDAPVIRLVERSGETAILTPLDGAIYIESGSQGIGNTTGIFSLYRGTPSAFFAYYPGNKLYEQSPISNFIVMQGYEEVTPVPIITGIAQLGETLASDVTAFPEANVLTYQWLRDDVPIPDADLPTYKLTTADLGAVISLRVDTSQMSQWQEMTPWGITGGTFVSAGTAPVAKTSQTAPIAPSLASRTDNSITLNTISGAQYRLGTDGNWQASPEFSGLTQNTSYTFYAYYPETSTQQASSVSIGTELSTTGPETQATLSGSVSISGAHTYGQTLTAVTSNLATTPSGREMGVLSYEWLRDDVVIPAATSSLYTLVSDDVGTTITLRVSAANCTGTVVSIGGSVVTKADQNAPAAFNLSSSWNGTSYTVEIPYRDNCEYSFDGITFSSSLDARFQADCSPKERIVGYMRYSATNTYLVSSPTSSALVLPLPPSTLSNPDSGVAVAGHFMPGTTLHVSKNSLTHAESSCAACDEIRALQKGNELLALYELTLQGTYEGPFEVSIPVGSQYNGQTLMVLHCADGVCEELSFTVRDGSAVGTVSSLSPFAVLKPDDSLTNTPHPGTNSGASASGASGKIPLTGDGHSGLLVVLLATSFSALLCFFVLRYMRKDKTERFGFHL